MPRISAVAILFVLLFVGCGQVAAVPAIHKYEPFGRYVVEIESVGSYSFKTSLVNRQSGDEVTQLAEYAWGNNTIKLDNGKLTFNGQECGTLEDKDLIKVDAKGRLTVNGKERP